MTKHRLRAYWWRGGPRHGNFGDLLTPVLLEHLSGRPVEHCSPHEADIIAVGSILEPGFCRIGLPEFAYRDYYSIWITRPAYTPWDTSA